MPTPPTPPRGPTPAYGSAVGRPPLAYLADIVSRCPTEFLELVAAVLLVGWGVTIALPADSFGASPAYQALRETRIPKTAWGLIVLALGLFQVSALAFRRTALRVWAVALSSAFWGLIAAAIVVAQSAPSTGASTYGVLAAASALVYLRHRL